MRTSRMLVVAAQPGIEGIMLIFDFIVGIEQFSDIISSP
jgi:hypothetical protein